MSRDKILRRNESVTAQLLQLLDDTSKQPSTSLSLVRVGCGEQDLKVKYVFVTFDKIFVGQVHVCPLISEGTEPTS